jgi:hypothetical protein
MSDQLAATNNLSLELVVMIVAVSIVAGTVDVLRQPGWAWRRAKESKPAYFVLVLLVPLVGLGMYLQIARPKVKAIASAGRAASLPFESFGDDAIQAQREDGGPVGTVIAAPERFGSFGATTVADGEIRLVGAGGGAGPQGAGPGGSFFSTGGDGGTATAALTRTYRPRQRTSIPAPEQARDDSASTSTVPPGWKADPTGRHQFRYWAGSQWTENVADNGEQSRDALTS